MFHTFNCRLVSPAMKFFNTEIFPNYGMYIRDYIIKIHIVSHVAKKAIHTTLPRVYLRITKLQKLLTEQTFPWFQLIFDHQRMS